MHGQVLTIFIHNSFKEKKTENQNIKKDDDDDDDDIEKENREKKTNKQYTSETIENDF